MTKYIIKPLIKSAHSSQMIFETKEKAVDAFNTICEKNTKTNYILIKSETVETVIKQSEDYRQFLMPF